MPLLPRRHIQIRTALTPEQVSGVLQEHTEPSRWLWMRMFTREHKFFEGTVGPDSFRIRRITRSRNSFVPLVKGKIIREPEGSLLHVSFGSLLGNDIPIVGWICVVLGIACFVIYQNVDLTSARSKGMGVFVLLGIVAPLLAIKFTVFRGFCTAEIDQAKQHLLGLLQGTQL